MATLTLAIRDQFKAMVVTIRNGLDYIRGTVPQLPKTQRWPALTRYPVDQIHA